MSSNLQTRYLRPVPHFFKYFSEVSSSDNISYAIGGKEISAWNPSDISNFSYLSCDSFGVTSNSLVYAQLENGSLNATVCSSSGVFRQSNEGIKSLSLPLQSNETCVHLIKQNEMFIVATSSERLFVVDLNLSAIKELSSGSAGTWMLSGLTRYARSMLWEDTRKTVSLTKFDSGLLHLTTTQAHIWDLVETDEKEENIYQIRRSVQILNTLSSTTNQTPAHEIILLHAVLSNEIMYVLSLVGPDYVLFQIVESNRATQVKSTTLRTLASHEVGNVGLLMEPIKICEKEIYILFRDCVVLCSSDLTSKPVKLVQRHILGSSTLPRSMLFYTPDGIYEHVNQKDEVEKKLFSEFLSRFLTDPKVMNSPEFSKPLSTISPSRMRDFVNEYCLFVLDSNQNDAQPQQSMIVETQLKDKTAKISSIFDFFAYLELHHRYPVREIKCLLYEYSEKLTFATLLRSELQKSNLNNNSFLYHVFYMQRDHTKGIEAFSEDSSAESFFSNISRTADIIPVMVEYQRIELSRTPLALRIVFDLIVSACYIFNVILKEPKIESKKNQTTTSYIPIFASPSTRLALKEQFKLIEKFFTELKQSNNLIQVKNTETFDTLYSSAHSIADIILSGYELEIKHKQKDQSLFADFKADAYYYIDFFVRSGKVYFAKLISAEYKIFDRLIEISEEKDFAKYKELFGRSPEFAQCLYSYYWKSGKISTLLDDPLFHDYLQDNDLLHSLHCLSREEYLDSYKKYVTLSLNEKNLAEKKRLVAIRKMIACQLDINQSTEKQMLEIIKYQDPDHLKEMPELKEFQELLFRHHEKGIYIEPKDMIYTVLDHSSKISEKDYVLLFQIFSFSTKLRNSSTKEASNIQSDIWRSCLRNTAFHELKFDRIRSDANELFEEIKKTLLYQVGTHSKASFYFIPDIEKHLLNNTNDDSYKQLVSETLTCIKKHNESARVLKEDEERIERLFFSHICAKPASTNENSLLFHNLLDSADLVAMQKALQKQAVLPSNSLFFNKPKQSYADQGLPLMPPMSQPPLTVQRILKERNTLPLTLASLKALPSKVEEKPKQEEQKNPFIDFPLTKVKQEPLETKVIPQSPMKSIPQSPMKSVPHSPMKSVPHSPMKSPMKSVPQSPLRFTNTSSETSDSKKIRQFSINSPSKFKENKEFSLSDALPDYDIYVDEEKLGAFDGVEIELEEIKEKFTSVQEKFVTVDHGYTDVIEKYNSIFEKNQNVRGKTPNRNDRPKK